MSLYIVRLRLTNEGMHVPEFERHIGPFRTHDAAWDVQQRLRARVKRHLRERLADADSEMVIEAETFCLDNRKSRYHYLDLERVVRDNYIGDD